jgi:hypothetical protein
MSAQFTEEASKIRSNAASSILQNELNIRDLSRRLGLLNLTSDTREGLSDNEAQSISLALKELSDAQYKLNSNIVLLSSAIAASNLLTSTEAFTTIFNNSDMIDENIKIATEQLAQFKKSLNDDNPKSVDDLKVCLTNALQPIKNTTTIITNTLIMMRNLLLSGK